MEGIQAFELFKEELENDEPYLRVNTIHRLSVVATLLGNDGIKSQLLPFLEGMMKKEDDEILFALASELGNLGFFPLQSNFQSNHETFGEHLHSALGILSFSGRDCCSRSSSFLHSS